MANNQKKFPRVTIEFRPQPVATLENWDQGPPNMVILDRGFYEVLRAVAQHRARTLHEMRVKEQSLTNDETESEDAA